ncbi:hypothetical protein KIPB_011312, partial [Kipferlia bialata]
YNKYVIDPNSNPSSISLTCSGYTQYGADYLRVYTATCDSYHNTSSGSRVTSDSGTINISRTMSSLSTSQCVYVIFDSDGSYSSGYDFSCSYTSSGSGSGSGAYTSLSGSFGPSSYYNNQYQKFIVHPEDLASATVSCSGTSQYGDYLKVYKAYCDSSDYPSGASFVTSDSGTIDINESMNFSSSSYNCFYVLWDTDSSGYSSSDFPRCSYTAIDIYGNTGDDNGYLFVIAGVVLVVAALIAVCVVLSKKKKGDAGGDGKMTPNPMKPNPSNAGPAPPQGMSPPPMLTREMLDRMSPAQLQMQMEMQQTQLQQMMRMRGMGGGMGMRPASPVLAPPMGMQPMPQTMPFPASLQPLPQPPGMAPLSPPPSGMVQKHMDMDMPVMVDGKEEL